MKIFRKRPLSLETLERKNFGAWEFVVSDIAEEEGIDNCVYDIQTLINLSRTADKAQEIRNFLKFPVKGNSFFRCLKLNRKVGSKDTSKHVKGQAGDFICPKFGTPEEIYLALKISRIVFDQCILEKGWIHFSIRETGKNRNQFIVL